MANTKKSFSPIDPFGVNGSRFVPKKRPEWQIMRGERYGNKRKAVAALKKLENKITRTRFKREKVDLDI